MAEKKLSNQSSPEGVSVQLYSEDNVLHSSSAEKSRPDTKNTSSNSKSKQSRKENIHPNTATTKIKKKNEAQSNEIEDNQVSNELSVSMDNSDTSPFAMLGNYLDESRLSQLGLGSIISSLRSNDGHNNDNDSIAITPAQWKGASADDAASGEFDASGILSFVGESPLFDEQHISNAIRADSRIAHCSAEETKHSAKKPNSITSPEMTPMNQNKGVKFADEGGWQTPKGDDNKFKYPKSPFLGEKQSITEENSMEPQVNPMNESVLISDDEASVESIEESGESMATSEEARGRSSKGTSPSKVLLMDRNKSLVKEIRFADQTCVELSAKNKYYKEQYGQVKKDLVAAKKDRSLLKESYDASLQENTRLKVLVESLQAQKDQVLSQVESYRNQISASEQSHRSDLSRWEDTHHSYLKNSQKQLSTLNDRLEESLAANQSLQGKLDAIEGHLEAKKLREDYSTDELIGSLKELVANEDDVTAPAAASIQESNQIRIDELQKLCEKQQKQLKQARAECEMISYDRDYWQNQCDGFHQQITQYNQSSDSFLDVFLNEDGSHNEDFIKNHLTFTPTKENDLHLSVASPVTPTSNLLARTLQSELKRRQKTSDKLEQAERKVTELKDEIDELKMDMEENRADKALLEEELDEKCDAITVFDDLLEIKDAEIKELKSRLDEQNIQIDRLLDEIDVMCNEESSEDEVGRASPSKEVRRTILSLEEQLEAAEGNVELTEEQLESTRDKLQRTSVELAQTKEELNEFDQSVEKLNKELSEAYIEIADQKRFGDFQAATIERINVELSKSSETNENLKKQVASFSESLKALDKILSNYEDVEDAVRQKLAEFGVKIAALTTKVNEINLDMTEDKSQTPITPRVYEDEANDKLRQALGYLEHLTNESQSLRNQLNAMNSELHFYKSGSTMPAESGVSKVSAVGTSKSDITKENEDLRVHLKACELQLESYKALLRSATQEAEGFRENAKASKAAFECLQAESSLTKENLSNLEEDCRSLRQKIIEKESELKQSQKSMSETQEKLLIERRNIETSLEEALKVNQSLQTKLDTNLDECDEKQQECEALIVQVQQIQSALNDARNGSAEQQEVIDKLELQLKEQNESLFSCEETMIAQKDDIRRLNNELHNVLTEKNIRIEMLEKGLGDRQMLFDEQLLRTKKERDESNADLTGMIDKLRYELQATNSSHKQFIEKSKIDTTEFESRIRKQDEEINSLQYELHQSDQHLQGTLRQLNAMEIDYSRLATKNDDDSEDVSLLRQQLRDLHASLEDLEDTCAQQSEDNDRLTKKCNTFKSTVRELNRKVKSWETSYRDQSDLLLSYSREISRLNGSHS